MKLAISNLAWDYQEDEAVKEILLSHFVKSIEIAPTKIWANPLETVDSSIQNYRDYWNSDRIDIVALQSLLFGRSDLDIFTSRDKRQETLTYLSKIIELGAGLGAKVFVFGSPKNRQIGEMEYVKAMDIAVDFFNQLGEKAMQYGTKFCIEPNPKDYSCDFITNTEEGIQLVKEVGHPGFGLHLDAGGMTLNDENIEKSIEQAAPYLCHFHISEPQLEMVKNGNVEHKRIAKTLKEIHYNQYVSIEMKNGLNDSNLETVRNSLEFVQEVYE